MKILARTITPKKSPFDFSHFQREFRDEFNTNVRKDVIKDFEKTVVGWRNKPEFGSRLSITPTKINFFVFATGPHAGQYNLVSQGSPPHLIEPRLPGGRLRYRTGYQASTRPRVISSRRSQRSGPLVTARAVNHPGFEGREFYETIGEVYLPDYQRRIKNALQRATNKLKREQGE